MVRRIVLNDIDRPDEPLEVEIEDVGDATITVVVPNTLVMFNLRRRDGSSLFEGSIGGRYFFFDPTLMGKAE